MNGATDGARASRIRGLIVIGPTAVEMLPGLGDHVQLIGTNIVGDVRQVIESLAVTGSRSR